MVTLKLKTKVGLQILKIVVIYAFFIYLVKVDVFIINIKLVSLFL